MCKELYLSIYFPLLKNHYYLLLSIKQALYYSKGFKKNYLFIQLIKQEKIYQAQDLVHQGVHLSFQLYKSKLIILIVRLMTIVKLLLIQIQKLKLRKILPPKICICLIILWKE